MLHFKWCLPISVCFSEVLFTTNSQHSLYLLRNQLKFKVQCQQNQYLGAFAICPCFFKDRRCYIQDRNGHNKFHTLKKKKKKVLTRVSTIKVRPLQQGQIRLCHSSLCERGDACNASPSFLHLWLNLATFLNQVSPQRTFKMEWTSL